MQGDGGADSAGLVVPAAPALASGPERAGTAAGPGLAPSDWSWSWNRRLALGPGAQLRA